NLIDKLNNFDEIKVIKDGYRENLSGHQGSTSLVGQYKFIDDDRVVYVLWGRYMIPEEIQGDVVVTDIYGDTSNMKSDEIIVNDSVIFVEILK
ncbi:hypothetical protein ACFL2R_03685, partial [Patescibacteria group bacterium]